MSIFQALVRGALSKVAKRVAKDGLFEKEGERVPTAPRSRRLEPEPGRGFSKKLQVPGPDPRALCQPAGLRSLLERISDQDGVLVLHHWATWCSPCEEELPLIQALAEDLQGHAEVLGLSWDAFEGGGDPQELSVAVGTYAKEHGVDFPSLLLTDPAEKVFKALDLTFQRIPQTRVLGPDGTLLLQHDGPMTQDDIDGLLALVRKLDDQ